MPITAVTGVPYGRKLCSVYVNIVLTMQLQIETASSVPVSAKEKTKSFFCQIVFIAYRYPKSRYRTEKKHAVYSVIQGAVSRKNGRKNDYADCKKHSGSQNQGYDGQSGFLAGKYLHYRFPFLTGRNKSVHIAFLIRIDRHPRKKDLQSTACYDTLCTLQ